MPEHKTLEHKTKATLLQKILVGLLIIANISLASFIWGQSQAKQGHSPKKEIPSELLIGHELIQSRLFELAGKSTRNEENTDADPGTHILVAGSFLCSHGTSGCSAPLK